MAKTKPRIKTKNPDRKTVPRELLNSYSSTHILFNLSFMTDHKDFKLIEDIEQKHLVQLIKRMYNLSREHYKDVMLYEKKQGFEDIKETGLKNPQSLLKNFNSTKMIEQSKDKFFIFRLYPNDNPVCARVIGKFIDKSFYILGICFNHDKLYSSKR